jgi:hypothetical protein
MPWAPTASTQRWRQAPRGHADLKRRPMQRSTAKQLEAVFVSPRQDALSRIVNLERKKVIMKRKENE